MLVKELYSILNELSPFELQEKWDNSGLLVGNMDDELNNWLFQNQEESVSLFRDLVSQGQEEGIINTLQDAHTYAYYLYNTFQGLRMTGMLTKDREVLQGILENTMRILK